MPCSDFSQLSDKTLDRAVRHFDRLSEMKLMPAAVCHADTNRHKIDDAVVDLLGLPKDRMSKILPDMRDKWCKEESVHGGMGGASLLRN